ncbi:MAG: 1-acyl-sn-glycerol-3-phosphate acyltransferase, partial [Aeromonas veronii]
GTRSQGRGLLPFKAGAFHTAVQAEVPVVPIVCSSYFGQVDLNRWDNGEVLVEVMAPVCSKEHGASGIRDLSDTCRARMEAKLAELDSKLGHSHAA